MQTGKTKEELRIAAEALFADLDAEFGSKAKKQKKAAAPVKKEEKKPQVSEGQEANKIAQLMSRNSPWIQTAVISHLITQVCKCCRNETEFVGNTLIRHVHRTNRNTIWEHILPEAPEHATLPRIVRNHRQMIEQCPACIRFNLYQMSLDAEHVQLDLFH